MLRQRSVWRIRAILDGKAPVPHRAFIDDEELMDVVTAVSGSGPAYVFHFIDCLERAGIAAGLPAGLARELAKQTVHGAGLLANMSDRDPAVLRQEVTSPIGTTAAVLAVLMGEAGLDSIVARAVEAARARSVELGKAENSHGHAAFAAGRDRPYSAAPRSASAGLRK